MRSLLKGMVDHWKDRLGDQIHPMGRWSQPMFTDSREKRIHVGLNTVEHLL